jgi:hypothetical protein
MKVSVARSGEDAAAPSEVHLTAQPSTRPGCLVHQAHLGAGVRVALDLMSPTRWRSVHFQHLDDAARPLVGALIGDGAAEDLRARTDRRPTARARRLAVDPDRAAPWLRVAVVDALDRWLHVPLDQSLVDAERGVSRGRAARTLPDGPARVLLIGDALRLARRASDGFAGFLHGLARHSHLAPNGLVLACKGLVDGYAELIDEVTGPDRELSTVVTAWRRLARRLDDSDRPSPGAQRGEEQATSSRPSWPRPTSMIDPRQVRARVFGLSGDPASAEVVLAAPGRADSDEVLVRVPAFGPAVEPEVRSRLLVRLVDRRSAAPKAHALLNLVDDEHGSGPAYYEATVPLCGLDASEVRADVFDAFSDLPPAGTDSDRSLREARAAVVFLGEWRRVVALARLPAAASAPARRMRELAARLRPSNGRADEPIFLGGPSAAELDELAGLHAEELAGRLTGDRGATADLADVTGGTADLLVAEIAAAHAEQGCLTAPALRAAPG